MERGHLYAPGPAEVAASRTVTGANARAIGASNHHHGHSGERKLAKRGTLDRPYWSLLSTNYHAPIASYDGGG